ncbi:helix-turn-helix- domain containing protein, AraC type [Alkaliphilus metalliredigens QYMF]|uniref:Helix-turn-helix-domain containing protein, AraC type n=1 Tax=Alkaliphilus metalliredigens (strain QYMF) TaxID=293826 RepID=A6TUQ9_ALKMQ|nr:AraC family transcriptional regulator [Alkaliphilus metalliredigens]ABR49927.1 helix-turn-helix- domain containing protein, AraC type [Alkaliphilus metalliredigens QYMF]
MIDNQIQNNEIFNPEDQNCPVCAAYNSIYRKDSFEAEMKLPEKMGKGFCQRIIVKPSMEISISDMTFHESLTMGGGHDKGLYYFAFCLGEALQWRAEGDKKEYEIDCGESCIFNVNQEKSICTYKPEQRFWGISIGLDVALVTNMMHHIGKQNAATLLSHGDSYFYKRKFSSTIKVILNDMIHCGYKGYVKKIYLEGKVLELIAVFMDEIIFENGRLHSSISLSASDINALHKARRILDENIVTPPTIGKLARLICLNEYKLKTGFKEFFGMPIHAYVIDKRLEMARFLMENKKLRVTETAILIGYSDASHFAEKFRRKYGVNPSEFIKNS